MSRHSRSPRTIGALAHEASVPVSTLRHYERIGLIAPESRSEGNYRIYGTDAVEPVAFICSAQRAGFTLADIRTLLALRDGDRALCKEVRPLVQERLAAVRSHLTDLRAIERTLAAFQRLCNRTAGDDPCRVVERLGPDASQR